MHDLENEFHRIKDKIPLEGQRVIAYNNKLKEFITAVFKNGKFYENDTELINITSWKENKRNIIF